jgi:hypothetical protein
MAVWSEAVRLVRLAGGQLIRRRRYRVASVTPQESRELAEVMRALPGRYADRLAPRTVQRITTAAAAGEWEYAIKALIRALISRSVPVTAGEREQLAAVADALGMPGVWVDALQPRETREVVSVAHSASTRGSSP